MLDTPTWSRKMLVTYELLNISDAVFSLLKVERCLTRNDNLLLKAREVTEIKIGIQSVGIQYWRK